MAIYQIEWKKSAAKELRQVDRKVIPRIISAAKALEETPYPAGTRKLEGSQNIYRLRIGNYRLIYKVIQNKILIEIIRIKHRKDVYR